MARATHVLDYTETMAALSLPLITEEEYLNTSYEPDREYVDGLLVERKVPTLIHSRVQASIVGLLHPFCEEFDFSLATECRVKAGSSRYRVPDVALIPAAADEEKFFSGVPLAIIEILSPDDRMQTLLDRLRDFAALGVENIFVFHPRDQEVFRYECGSLTRTKITSLRLPAGEAPFSSDELFAQIKPGRRKAPPGE